MTPAPFTPQPRGIEPPLRRVLAVDAGSRCIRLLLLESRFGKLRLARQETLDLREEGLVAPEELKTHLQAALANWGRPPLALALPQDMAVSQIVDLPPLPDPEARAVIEAETVKLGGVSESAMLYDFVRVPRVAENRQSFWVNFCQEGEVQARITQLGLEEQDFREITTAANALLAAWQAARPGNSNAVIVHLGAQNTTLLVIRDGIGVFATSFPMAGDFFARAITRLTNCSLEAAHTFIHTTNLLEGAKQLPGFPDVVDGWAAELKRQLSEWRGSRVDLTGELIATGGAFAQPGLREYLAQSAGLKFQPWPRSPGPASLQPEAGFEIAFGAALLALGQGRQTASLLPANRRLAWKKRRGRQRVEFLNTLLLGVLFVALALGLWQKVSLVRQQQALTEKVQAGLKSVQEAATLSRELFKSYDELRPLFERQQRTTDTLQSLALLESARSDRAWWGVLIADQQSYFAAAPAAAATNKPPGLEGEFASARREATNASPARPGLVAELCVPADLDAARSTLSAVVNNLKRAPVFERVDVLSEDLRRSLADSKVLVPDRHFALVLDFAATQFVASASSKIRPAPAARPPGNPASAP